MRMGSLLQISQLDQMADFSCNMRLGRRKVVGEIADIHSLAALPVRYSHQHGKPARSKLELSPKGVPARQQAAQRAHGRVNRLPKPFIAAAL